MLRRERFHGKHPSASRRAIVLGFVYPPLGSLRSPPLPARHPVSRRLPVVLHGCLPGRHVSALCRHCTRFLLLAPARFLTLLASLGPSLSVVVPVARCPAASHRHACWGGGRISPRAFPMSVSPQSAAAHPRSQSALGLEPPAGGRDAGPPAMAGSRRRRRSPTSSRSPSRSPRHARRQRSASPRRGPSRRSRREQSRGDRS